VDAVVANIGHEAGERGERASPTCGWRAGCCAGYIHGLVRTWPLEPVQLPDRSTPFLPR
jgi:hypothetical protein